MTPLDVIVAGHACLDMFPKFIHDTPKKIPELFQPGKLIKMGSMEFSTGGAVANAGIAFCKFGLKVGFVAKVGNDTLGTTILETLKKFGNADGCAITNSEGSSYSVVLSPPGIDRIFLHCPGTNDSFVFSDIDFSFVERCRLFHFGYPTLMKSLYSDGGLDLARIFEKAHATGAITSLDISLPDPDSDAGQADWLAIYTKALPFVDIFVPSIEEALFTLHPHAYLTRKAHHNGAELIDHISPDEYSDLASEFLGLGCKIIALKSGHNGWYIKTGPAKAFETFGKKAPSAIASWADRELWCPAFRAERIASATGSGDSSIAAFLSALVKGYSLEQSLKYANCAGCMNLSAMDATSGLATWEQMATQIDKMQLREIKALKSAQGWRYNETKRIWEKNSFSNA